jgi:hypothetical protein
MAKPLFLLLNGRKRKRDKKDAEAIRTLSVLWSHHFRELTHARRLNILSQTHPNHVGLLSRAADKLPVGGEDLFGPDFITELVSRVKTAAQVSSSLAGPAATSTPAKSNDRRSPPPFHDSRNNNRYVDFSSSLFSPGFCDTAHPVDACVSRVAGRTALFVDAWARLTKNPWVLSTVAFGFQLDFIDDPPFQLSIPPNASMDDIQFDLCAAEVDALIKKGAVVETEEKGGYISRYFLVPKKGPNEWRPIINLKPLNQFLRYRKVSPHSDTPLDGGISLPRSILQTPILRFLSFEVTGSIFGFVGGVELTSIRASRSV